MSSQSQVDGDMVPSTRGFAARAPLARLDDFRPGTSALAIELIPSESLAVIESTRALDWVPAVHERYVAESVFAVLGHDAGIEYFRWIASQLLETSLLRPFTTQVGRMFGVDPGTILRVAPRPFGLVFRDFGRIVPVDRGPRWAIVELRDAPPIVFEAAGYRDSWRGVLGAFFDLSLTPGTVELEVKPEASTLRYQLNW